MPASKNVFAPHPALYESPQENHTTQVTTPVVALDPVRFDRLQLFKRLPRNLYQPSSGANLRYWDMLCRLMGSMWGEGGRSSGEEVPKPTVLRTIESFLVADAPWKVSSPRVVAPIDVAALLDGV